MQIGSSSFNPMLASTGLKAPGESTHPHKPHVSERHRRSADVGTPEAQQTVQAVKPAPVDLGANPSIDPATQEISEAFKSARDEASIYLKNKFAEMAAKAQTPAEKEKWDIDPDNTYLVTFDYNSKGERPYPAKIIKRISLTEALVTNAQDTPRGKGYSVPFYAGGPEVIVKPDLKTHKPGISDFPSRAHPHSEKANTTHTFQGIYKESAEEPAPVYNGANQSSITPAEFKKLIWNADFKKPYDQFLDEFWSSHREQYPTLAKASLVKSAESQYQEGSLTSAGRDLIMRAAGLPGNQTPWPDLKIEDLQKKPPQDPDIEVGMLKIGNFQSTDLMYVTDNKIRYDTDGKRIPPLTLLHIPGNSSPIHTFSSQAEMKVEVAKWMADPVKREAIAAHFPLKDKPNGYAHAGIDETLKGLGTWPEKRETPGGLFSYDHRAFTGFWDPQKFITTEPSSSPFEDITKRQKDRSYADAAVDITSDRDVTKKRILSALEKATKAAMFLTPLALLVPEIGLAMDAYYLVNAATTTGIAIDDKVHGKPKANERIVFGVLNAAFILVPKGIKAWQAGEGSTGEIESSPLNPGAGTEPHAPGSEPGPSAPDVNRLRPSQWHDVSGYAVTEGEQLIAGKTPNAKGIYQVKDFRGDDRWFIRITDDNGARQVYEIDGRFKLRDGYANIIDPFTKKPVMTVHASVDGTWETLNGPGGIKFPWNSPTSSSAKKVLEEHIGNINKPIAHYSDAEREAVSNSMGSMIKESTAEQSQSITEYIEGGSADINGELRAQSDPTKYSKRLKKFLSDLDAQADYHGTAYRYSYVSADGAKKLKEGVGKVFRGPAVQSSSTQPFNVKGWDNWAKDSPLTQNNQPVIYIFNASIPKKNLASGFLVDHAVVKPNVSLEVMATTEKDGILYVYFNAPTKMPKERYNLFDGSVARPF